jgi:large subunit ribosomal protein L18
MYAQVIDDTKGVTLVSASTMDKELKDKVDKVQC